MKADSVKKNMVFQFAYQFVVLVVPLIIAPYLTRILGENSLGIYSYTYSIAYYFVLFCMLGIVKHGQRIIAERRDDEILLRKTFWSLFFVHAIASIIGVCGYLIVCLFVVNKYISIYLIQSLYVLSALFDITWLFYGIEKIKIVVLRNAFVKIGELVFIFLLVRGPGDLLTYTLIMAISALLSNALLIPIAIKHIKPIKFEKSFVVEHLKPLFVLSVSVFAISMFTVFDKTLLGIMTTTENVAFYEYSNKIINIPKMFIVVVGTVIFPRACSCLASNDFAGINKYYRYSLLVVYFIGFGAVFGLISISNLFSVIYFGNSFEICGSVIKALSPIILIIGLGDIFRSQFLIPLKKDFQYTLCVIVNAIINILLSIILIPKCGIYGAVIGTVSAEMFGLFYQGYLVRNYINIKDTIIKSCPFVMSGILMFAAIKVVKTCFNSTILDLLIQVAIGGGIYIGALCIWFSFFDKDKMEYRRVMLSLLRRG